MTRPPTMIRNVDRDLLLQVRLESVRRGVPIGELVNEALRQWLERQRQGEASEQG